MALEHLVMIDVDIGVATVPIPKVFRDLVEFVRRDMFEEGIFRKAGSKVRERALVKMLDSNYMIPEEASVIDACTVIKVLIRNIPGKLIPKDIAPWFLEAGKLESKASAEALNLCVLLLPLDNLYLLVFLMEFFEEVAANSDQNKMTTYNLAVVIAPNLFATPSNITLANQSALAGLALTITETLIKTSKHLGVVPAVLLNKLEELHEELASKKTFCQWFLNFQQTCWKNMSALCDWNV